MPRVTITGIGDVNFPDTMSPDEIKAAIERDILPRVGVKKPAQLDAIDRANMDPTKDMSTFDRTAAGVGKAIVDTGRGIKQLASYLPFGPDRAEVQKEIDDAKKRDEALMDTGAGMAGNVIGNVGMALAPAGALTGSALVMQRLKMLKDLAPLLMKGGQAIAMPNTLTGAAAVGGVQGLAQPVASEESRLSNIGWGAGGGAGGVLAGRALDATARGGKALVEPFYQSGRESVLGRTLNRFAGDADAAAKAIKDAPEFVAGSRPSLAEASGDAGLAGLQLAAANNDPKIKAALTRLGEQNAGARVEALRGVAGSADELAFHKEARSATAQELYSKAFGEVADSTPWIKGEISKLMQRPAFVSALRDGQEMALNLGRKVSEKHPENATEILHYTKLSLDDEIEKATAQSNGNKARALIDTRDKLVSLMESKDFSPSYREARDTFKQMSGPIDRMEVGQDLLKKLTPALTDFAEGNATRNNGAAFAQAMREADATVARATGSGARSMEEVMSPDQLSVLRGIGKDLERKSASEARAKTIGSTTAQNLSGQNLLRQVIGPLGMPESWAESMVGLSVARPFNWLYKIPENKLQDELARLLVDAKEGGRVMTQARTKGLTPEQIAQREALARILGGAPGLAGPALQSRD